MALGASRRSNASSVIRGLSVTLVGIVAGGIAALALARLRSSLLFGIEPTDPLTFVAVATVLAAVAVVASYLPARRAMRVDPITVLRDD